MAIRRNHYDVAFEAYLRSLRMPYVAVDETKRALSAESSLKSMDFIVYSPGEHRLLVDVKGRRFPSSVEGNRHCWENWATQDDIDSLLKWQRVFGEQFRATLLFAYEIIDDKWLDQHEVIFPFCGRTYAFYGVWVDEYARAMRTRSARWATVGLPAADFRRLRDPVHRLLRPV